MPRCLGSGLSAIVVWSLIFAAASCSTERPTPTPSGDGSRSLAALEAIFAHDPRVAALVAPRETAFVRMPNHQGEDAEHRGRLVSEGWRSAKQKRFTDIGVRLPDAADGEMDVGVSRFAARRLRVRLAGAAASPGVLSEGRVVYATVFPGADRVIVSDASALEELLILHDERAPRAFTWTIDLPELVDHVSDESSGALRFEDRSGKPVLFMAAPMARDAKGHAVALTSRWDAAGHALHIALADSPSASLAYPVAIDPRYETSVWTTPSTYPSARTDHAMAFDSARGVVVLFGGTDEVTQRVFGDTWTWDGATWTQRVVPNGPGARAGHRMAFDAARGQTVLFGGAGRNGVFGDTWIWNGIAWSEVATTVAPRARNASAMTFDGLRNEVVLFGGSSDLIDSSETNALGDTWTWNGVWTMHTPQVAPRARSRHSLAFDGSQVVLVGGAIDNAPLQADTWLWNGTTWTEHTGMVLPPAHYLSILANDGVGLVLFGGIKPMNGRLDETWLWRGTAWSKVDVAAPPPPRGAHAGVSFLDNSTVTALVFGGSAVGGGFEDLWQWRPASSSWVQRAGPPPSQYALGTAYDSARNEIVAFGGSSALVGGTQSARTATWNGRDWSIKSPTLAPSARSHIAMAFDPTRSEVVLFGGLLAPGVSNETWTWNGAAGTWTLASTPIAPSARFGHRLVFDGARGEVVLFGGRNASTPFNDTWVWKAGVWTEKVLSVRPRPRSWHSLVFANDPVASNAVVLMFGGNLAVSGPDVSVDDTWTWDGTTWTERLSAIKPSGRFGMADAFEAISGDVIVWSGADNMLLPDMWAWRRGVWSIRSGVNPPPARVFASLTYDAARRGSFLLGGGNGLTPYNAAPIFVTFGAGCTTSASCGALDAYCVDGVCCNVASCGGSCQTCSGESPGRCSSVLSTQDPDTCAGDQSCSAVGVCKAALGVAATTASECASGFVTDGVCCESETCGACRTCNAAGAAEPASARSGFCAIAPLGDDPDPACVMPGACAGASTLVSPTGSRIDCGLYRCEASACRTTCERKAQCVGGADCTSEGRCVPFIAPPEAANGCGLATTRPIGGTVALAIGLIAGSARRRRSAYHVRETATRAYRKTPIDDTPA